MLIRTGRFTRARARAAALGAVVFATSLVTTTPVASAAPGDPSCNTAGGIVTCTFLPIGAMVPWLVPADVTSVRALVIGGKGGSSGAVAGGNSSFSYGTFTVTPGETLQISVGGNGSGSTAGWNGGGAGTAGAGGGGASDIRKGGSALANRIIIAGGGGGAGASTANGTGGAGGTAGIIGSAGSSASGFVATGGGAGGGLFSGGAGGTSVEPSPSDWLASPNYDASGFSGSLGQGGTYLPNFGAAEGGGGGGGGGRFGGGSGAGGKFYTYTGTDLNPPFVTATGAGGGGGGGTSFLNVALTDSGIISTTDGPSIVLFHAAPSSAPTISPIADISVDSLASACSATVVAPTTSTTGTPLPTESFSPTMPSVFPVGTTGVTATATNGVSPDATANFRVTVRDVTPPKIENLPLDITTIATDSAGALVDFIDPTVSDNCPNATVFQSDGPASGDTFPPGATTVTYTATDGSNNTVTESFTVTVQVPPTVDTTGLINVVTDRNTCSATNVSAPTVLTTGVPTPTVSFSPSLAGPFPKGATPVTATASNGVAPDATARILVAVSDRQPPTLLMPLGIVVPATGADGAIVNYSTPTAVDNCGTVIQLRPVNPAHASGNRFPIGTTRVEWLATDDSSNAAFNTFSITVTPTAPSVGPIAPVFVDTDLDTCRATNVAAPTVLTGGFPAPTVTFTPSLAGPFLLGTTGVTATASNGTDPAATTLFGVTVRDRQSPSINTPANIVVPATGPGGAIVTFDPVTMSDNCGIKSGQKLPGLDSGDLFPIGITTLSYEATDVNDNATSKSFTVTVEGAAPTIAPIREIFVPTDPDVCSAAPPQPVPVVTGVPAPTVSFSPAWPGTFPLGAGTVTVTATNGIGPDATTSFRVTVIDRQAPTLVVPGNIELQATSAAGRVVTYGAISARDNCTAPFIVRTAGLASGSTFPLGTTTVTYQAIDGQNVSERSFTVTITGAPPTIAPIADIATTTEFPTCSAMVPAPTPSTTGVPVPTVTFSPSFANPFPLGSTTVTATATNGIAPDATTSFKVVVTDAYPPDISALPNVIVNATGPSGAKVTYAPPSYSDNCPGVMLTRTVGPASGSTFPIGDTTVTYVARDGSGNTGSSTFVVHVAGVDEQLTALYSQVAGTGPGRSLASELAEAQREFRHGDLRDACRELDSFVSKVRAQRGKKLTRQQADAFVAAAQQIISVIDCRHLPRHRDRDRH